MRSGSRLGLVVALSTVAVLCLAAAAILKWVVVPSTAKLPSDENTTRQYDGTAKVLLNPQALSSGNLAAALQVNVPVHVSRNVRALATDGDVAEVQDTRTLTTANGQPIGSTQAKYAVDRKTLQATSNHPAGWQVTAATGLTVSWPIGSHKTDYTGWVQETQTTTPLKYLREETKQGLDTYVYQANTQPEPIKDRQVLAALPATVPVATVVALAPLLPLSAQEKAQLAAALPRLTQPVPVNYTYQVNSMYWVEPTTGLVVDTQREEIRTASLALPGQPPTTGFPVFDVSTAFTSASVSAAVSDAGDKKNKINLYATTLPLILLIVGIVAALAALLTFLLSRRSATPPRPAPIEDRPPPDATG